MRKIAALALATVALLALAAPAGALSYSRTLSFDYRSVCDHWLGTWAWDQAKSPQSGYEWSYRDSQVAC